MLTLGGGVDQGWAKTRVLHQKPKLASTQKSLLKADKTKFSPLWWVFLCGFNRFKLGGLNWVG